MECKNCKATLKETANFCDECGAKVIKQRLTLKIIFSDFFATFVSWDNALIKTFIQLFKNPEKVINTYINGTRKRYIKPFTYLLIVLSIYGIYMLFATDLLIKAVNEKYIINEIEIKFNTEFIEKVQTFSLFFTKYSNLFYLSLIPLYAILSNIVYKKQQYNYVEHIIIQTYIQAQVLVTNAIITSILLLFSVNILLASNLLGAFMYIYYIYVFKKIFNISYADTLLKFLFIILIFITISILISIIIAVTYAIILKLQNGM